MPDIILHYVLVFVGHKCPTYAFSDRHFQTASSTAPNSNNT